MAEQHVGDLPADGADRIERGPRVLEDHGDASAADRREIGGQKINALEQRLPASDAPGGLEQPHDRIGRD